MKLIIKKLIISWFFKSPIRKFCDNRISKDDTMREYLNDLLYRDEVRMAGSKEGLQGYYDIDIEINRELQKSLYERD